jgi:hypothetical protein
MKRHNPGIWRRRYCLTQAAAAVWPTLYRMAQEAEPIPQTDTPELKRAQVTAEFDRSIADAARVASLIYAEVCKRNPLEAA